jgi:hypothetical protein
MGTSWSNVSAGFAQGPVKTLDLGQQQVIISAFWTDEDGIRFDVDACGDLLDPDDLTRLGLAMIQMAAITGPAETSEEVA